MVHSRIGRLATRSSGAAAALALAFSVLIIGSPVGAQDPQSDDGLPKLIGEPYEDARDMLLEFELEVRLEIEEFELEVRLEPEEFAADDDVVVIAGVGGDLTDRVVILFLGTYVPDLQGEPGSDVPDILDRHDLRLEIEGEFVGEWEVAYQSPPPDTLLEFGDAVLVDLEPVDRGGNGWWPWLLLTAVAIVGVALVSRAVWRRNRGPTDGPEDRDTKARPQVKADPVVGRPRIELEVPSSNPMGHTVRFYPVMDAASHTTEVVDT